MDGYCMGWLEEDSLHSLERAKERAGLNERRARKMIDLARNRGVQSKDCHWNADRIFLENHCSENAEAVAFNGYCFVLERQTRQCITLFALPKNFGKKKVYYTRIYSKKTCNKKTFDKESERGMDLWQ